MVEHHRIDRPTIAVAGLGPRGMVIVERLIAQLSACPDQTVDLLLFDTNQPGAGVHKTDLPDYLLLNTVAGQLSFYPHKAAVSGHARHSGPTLFEWCREKGIRLSARGGLSADPACRLVEQGDFLPRRLLGQYLEDCASRLLAQAPAHIRLRHIAENLVDVTAHDPSGRQCLITSSGKRYWADSVFLSLGHAPESDVRAAGIRPRETIAVSGLGLTAMDTVAALTKGRGGLFVGQCDRLRYVQSGREPRIFLMSRTGLPFHARPDWSPEDDLHRVRPIFLTRPAIDRLRRQGADPEGRLCFRTGILPLLTLDMHAAYHVTRTRLAAGQQAADALVREFESLAEMPDRAAAMAADLDGVAGRRDVQRLLQTTPVVSSAAEFSRDYKAHLEVDVEQSRLGISGSPVKAAAEVWRNQRDILRYAVNGHGLTDASRTEFYRVYAPLSNRLVGGPQKERHAELLALCDAGLVTLLPPQFLDEPRIPEPLSGGSTKIDRSLPAFTGSSGANRCDSTIMRNLLASGRIRPVAARGPDGISVDAHGHPLDAEGNPDPAIWLVGPPVEGASFYNHYVGTPAPDCPLFVDAEREVSLCLERLAQRRTALSQVTHDTLRAP